MPTKYKIMIISGIALFVVIFVTLFIMGLRKGEAPTEEFVNIDYVEDLINQGPQRPNGQVFDLERVVNETQTVSNNGGNNTQTNQGMSSAVQEQNALKSESRNFVERFSTYSSSGNYGNFDVLKPLMTPSMQTWVDNYKKELQEKYRNSFYSIETATVSAQIYDMTSTNATIIVTTKRTENNGGIEVYVQDARIEFVKLNGVWKVNGLYFDGEKKPF